MKNLSFLLLFFCISFNLQSQNKNKLGAWYMYNGTHLLTKKINLKTSAHFRYFDVANNYQQEIYRVGVNYTFNKKINATTGSVYSITDTSYKAAEANLNEYRLYQDLNYKKSYNKLNLKQRIRLAQRFTKQNAVKKTKHRIRYGVFFKYPLFKKINAYAFNETFIKFAIKSFGQNRIGTGFIKKTNNNFKVKVGYLQVQSPNKKNHRFQFGILVNTNHLKKIS